MCSTTPIPLDGIAGIPVASGDLYSMTRRIGIGRHRT
jgi:hypothetical protein